MISLRKALMATTAIAFASVLAVPAGAQDPSAAPGVVKSGEKMKLRLYGQVARGFGVINDGETSTFKQFDNGNTSTRMGIDGRGKITKDVKLRTRLEYEIENGSANQLDGQGKDDDGLKVRHLDANVSHKRFGAVWIGRGNTASNGTSEKNLLPGGGSGREGGSTHDVIKDAVVLGKDSGTVEPAQVDTLGKFFDNFDGLSRRQRIRYDTPTIAGFKIGASAIDQQSWDVAAHFKGKIAGVKIKAGVGFAHAAGELGRDDGEGIQDFNQLNGSVSVLTPFGLGATFSGGKQWLDYMSGVPASAQRTPYNINPAIFYTANWTELGPTGVEYAYQFSNEITDVGDEGQGHSVMLTQVLANTGTDTFVTFRYFDVKRTGTDPENLWFFGGGFRARF